MPTIYVRKWSATCAIAAMLAATPVSAEISDLSALIDEAKKRPAYALEVPQSEIDGAVQQISDYLTKGGDEATARKMLADIAHPERIDVDSDLGAALLQTMAYKSPAKYVQAVLSGKQLNLRGVRSTAALQAEYDALVGKQKPLTILKNDREFLMVQRDGSYELFADDTQFLVQKSHTQPRVAKDDGYAARLDSPEMLRKIVLTGDAVIERTLVVNPSAAPKEVAVYDEFASDFKDMFEVRGWKREKRGQLLPPQVYGNTLKLTYKGADGLARSTTIVAGRNARVSKDGIRYKAKLPPHGTGSYEIAIFPSPSPVKVVSYASARRQADLDYRKWRAAGASVQTDSADWNRMLERGWKDLYMLKQRTAGGEAIAAGTPWFAAPFGRDQLITSMQMLAFRPDIARNVLKLLAHYQGTREDAYRAEKPGKIMHELRIGEMARNREIPFTPYYGTVDATPLWVVLLGRYFDRTGDLATLRSLDNNLQSALAFLQNETAETGYLRYGGHGKEALSNQGWKDSGDSVAYSNGQLAKPPIALSEVQGYLFEALIRAANLECVLGHESKVAPLDKTAIALRAKFNRDFWMNKEKFIALALDGDGKQVDVVSSNPGHLLQAPIFEGGRGKLVSERLMKADMFTGFGIRTLSSNEHRYFPNSYHNGSVWPHDVSLICAGMHEVSPESAARLADAIIAAAKYQHDYRLPELFGGYPRDKQNVPIPYPVSCEPQAWAAGTPFIVLTACSGIRIDAPERRVTVAHPRLPMSISKMTFRNLPVGSKDRISLEFTRTPSGTQVRATSNPGKLGVCIVR